MTKKTFEQVAGMIRRHRLDDNGTASGAIASIADEMACIFEGQNPRFDRARFFTACGMDEDGGDWVI